MQEKLLSFICQKNQVSYILFDTTFTIVKSFEIDTGNSSDVREILFELVGYEEEILADKKIEIPMIVREDNYYDLFVEPFYEDDTKLFIAYMQTKSKETKAYADVLKEINKKTLVFDTSDEKKEKQSYKEINKRLLSLHVDQEGKITQINDAVSYFFNQNTNSILGMHFAELFTPQSTKKDAKGSIFVAKNAFEKEIFFHADIIPIRNKNGNIIENIIVAQDITYLKEIEKELEYAQEHDTLTGLPNRHYLLRTIDSRDNATIALLDIVDFKTVNEEYGSHAGDMLLKHTASLITAVLEPQDILARLFGDTFVIIFAAEKNSSYASSLLNKIIQTLQKNPLYYTQDDIIDIEVLTTMVSMDSTKTNAKTLLEAGQKALSRKKLSKKNASL